MRHNRSPLSNSLMIRDGTTPAEYSFSCTVQSAFLVYRVDPARLCKISDTTTSSSLNFTHIYAKLFSYINEILIFFFFQ